MAEQRWQDAKGISDLSIAIDEIYRLRAMLADEADILEVHLGYKTFPKSRRGYAEEQIERMRLAAKGHFQDAIRSGFNAKRSLRNAGADECLTNYQWAEQRKLVRAPDAADPVRAASIADQADAKEYRAVKERGCLTGNHAFTNPKDRSTCQVCGASTYDIFED